MATTNNILTLQELEDLRTLYRQSRNITFRRREQLFQQGKITQQLFDKMVEEEEKLDRLIDEINDSIFDTITVDIQEPAKKIELSIEKANKAIEELKEIDKILGFVNAMINLAQNLIGAVTTGDFALIASSIDQIANLPSV